MGYRLFIELMGLPPTGNELQRSHWRVIHRHAKYWKSQVGKAALIAGRPPAPLDKAELTLTRYSSKEPDKDNLAISFKSCVDGLKEIGVIIDDKPSVIGQPRYLWENSRRGKGKISIEVLGVACQTLG